jgi:ribokinase
VSVQILNFGSLNIDHVYAVERFVRAGETLDTRGYEVFAGGKGFNQSIALARAGARVAHAGCVGEDGRWLVEALEAAGADAGHVVVGPEPTGHALIQVSPDGENCILIHGGANRNVSERHVDAVLEGCAPGTTLLLQNEINALDRIFDGAARRDLHVALNPSPMTDSLRELPLERVSTFLLNRSEGEALSGEAEPERVLDALGARFPAAEVVLTLGAAGARYAHRKERLEVAAERVRVVDTTAAGDTFTGYFLAERLRGATALDALGCACRAAALAVQRPGAAASIPRRAEL